MRNRTGSLVGAAAVMAAITVGAAQAADAQELSRVSMDSVGAIDLFRGDGTTGNPGVSLDISSVVRVGNGWSIQLRPWLFKSSANGSTWSRELYQAALRYERPGTTSVRVDAGYIASPIGLGMLDMRADVNPTIQSHPSYFLPLPRFDRDAPIVRAMAASYPLGANVTVSTTRWDARGAIVNSAPMRRYAFNSATGNPRQTPVGVAGAGVTLVPGLRVGTSIAAGHYATTAELRVPAPDARTFRTWTAEAEYAFGYTKVAAEFTRTRFDYAGTADVAGTWFVQGIQTLSPRWFVAARHETVAAPAVSTTSGDGGLSFRATETSVGYRLTPEITLRSSLLLVRGYTASAADRRFGVQAVWSRRWW